MAKRKIKFSKRKFKNFLTGSANALNDGAEKLVKGFVWLFNILKFLLITAFFSAICPFLMPLIAAITFLCIYGTEDMNEFSGSAQKASGGVGLCFLWIIFIIAGIVGSIIWSISEWDLIIGFYKYIF